MRVLNILVLVSSLLVYIAHSACIPEIDEEYEGFFTCNSTYLIKYEEFCDGEISCDNGSDEVVASNTFQELDPFAELQSCHNPTNPQNISCLVSRDDICEGQFNCSNLTPCDLKCDSYYKCQNNECVHRSTVCDGYPVDGCSEDHEWKNGVGYKCIRNGRECVLPQQLLHDDIWDCDNGVDLCFGIQTRLNASSRNEWQSRDNLLRTRCFMCLNDIMVIPASRVCDGIIDCSDMTDECLCEDNVPKICRQVIVDVNASKVKENEDFKIGGNTTGSPVDRNVTTAYCDVGHVLCKNGKCIARESVCDGIKDCDEDESYEICKGTMGCKDATKFEEVCRCDPKNSRRNVYGAACDGKADCPPAIQYGYMLTTTADTYPEDECDATCAEEPTTFECEHIHHGEYRNYLWGYSCDASENTTIPDRFICGFKYCDGKIDCVEEDDENYCENDYKRFYCDAFRPGYVSIMNKQLCDGIVDCKDGIDESTERCGEEKFSCPALGGKMISIDRSLVCDFSITCDDASDEMNCTDDRFYCEKGYPLFVRSRQKFDSRGDCSDWSDECPSNDQSRTNAISSRDELIASPVLRTLVWIMALLAITGNLAVIIREGWKLRNIGQLSSAATTNRLLILNLAVSDLLMGVYLLGLAIMTIVMKGRYCSEDLAWRSSSTCLAFGILTVVSSETSVITMVLLTACRLYAVTKPFKSSRRPRKRDVFFMILLAWMTSLLLAFIPLTSRLSETFVSGARLAYNPYLRNAVTSLDSAKELFKILVAYDLKPNVSFPGNVEDFLPGKTYFDLETEAKKYFVHQKLEFSSYMSYYSNDSVCIPKYFISTSDPAWIYSFIVNLFNFLAFTFVASAYVGIYVKSSRNSSESRPSNVDERQMRTMQRKILRLIITDFCCWIPICIMAFCKLGGVNIGPTAYAVSAIVLLPINSALNPMLYSDMLDSLYKKIFKNRIKTPSQQTAASSNRSSRSSTLENAAKVKLEFEEDDMEEKLNVNDTKL